jgi:glycosyltransferase involved in cell wall biosynthesis
VTNTPEDDRIRVLNVLWRLSRGGGAPIVVRQLLLRSEHDHVEMHACTVRPRAAEDRLEELGPNVALHALGLTGPTTLMLRARAIAGVLRVVRRVRPHVLHVHSGTASYSLAAAVVTRQQLRIIEVHDAPQSNRLSRRNQWVERFMHRHLGFTPLVHSSAVRQDVAEAWSVPSEEITLIPLGIDTSVAASAASRAAARTMLGVSDESPLVVYVARMVPEKRPQLFLDVAEKILRDHPSARFALIGGGSELAALRDRIAGSELAGSVAAPGFVDDLAGVYQAADVFLSTSRYEGFGLAIAEAMAHGVPVVSTDVGGVSDVIGDAGVLVTSESADDLSAAVVELLDDRDRADRLGRSGRRRAKEHLDIAASVRATEALYLRGATR